MEILANLSSDSSSDSFSNSSSLLGKDSLLDESSFESSSTSADESNFVPLILRLFEHLVRHSRYSDTWRTVLLSVRDQLLGYVAGGNDRDRKSDRMDCGAADPFYADLYHTICLRRHRRSDLESVHWTMSVAQCRTVRVAFDSAERQLTLRSCSSSRRPGIDCCRSGTWTIRSLADFADSLEAVYRSSVQLCGGSGRGRFHGERRG